MEQNKSCITINCGCCGNEKNHTNEKYLDLTTINPSAHGSILKVGNIVTMICTYSGTVPAGGVIMTIPEEYRPARTLEAMRLIGYKGDIGNTIITFNADGTIVSSSAIPRNYFDLSIIYQTI